MPNARYVTRKQTVGGTQGKGREAPITAIRGSDRNAPITAIRGTEKPALSSAARGIAIAKSAPAHAKARMGA